MPRKQRIHYSGALYHIIVRGNNREWIFRTESEKQRYLECIAVCQKKYNFRIYAYVVMSNHAHMLIKVDQIPLSKIMQSIQQSYTGWYNRKRKGTGHVFEQRYKATLCNEDTYLLALIRYIHQNPQRAKLPEGLDYPWSSHAVYIGNRTCPWLDRRFPLSLFGEQNRTEQYLVFMDETEETVGQVHWGKIEEGTKDNVSEGHTSESPIHRMDLNSLIKVVCTHFGVIPEQLTDKSRRKTICTARKAVVQLGKKKCSCTGKELALALGISEAAVSQLLVKSPEGLEEVENLIALP